MRNQSFSSIDEIRKEAYGYLKEHRETFVKIVLKKYGINITGMSKREYMDLFEEKKIEIVKDETLNRDVISINGKVVGWWNRNYLFYFKNGGFYCSIEYYIK